MNDGYAPSVFERCKRFTEAAKDVVQLVAIVVGGIWVLLTFGLKECPTREPHFEVNSNVIWYESPMPQTCYAGWQVSVKNLSSRAVEIGHVKVAAWPFEPPMPGEKPTFVEFSKFRPTDPDKFFFNREFDRGDPPEAEKPLIGHYAPDVTASHSFEWIFKKGDSKTWVGFELAFYSDKKDKNALWYAYEWWPMCPPEKAATPARVTL